MEPMKPMKPMAPMEPMKPMEWAKPWWPEELGQPATSGGQNDVKYAFFPDKRRLLVQQAGEVTTYDTADLRIGGVSQQSSGQSVTFTSQNGTVDLKSLKRIA